MADIFSKCAAWTEASQVKEAGIYPFFRRIDQTDGRSVTIDGKRLVMVGSNNYLGLTHHPRVMEAGRRALAQYGSGCTGSRLLNGNLALHEELESRLANFVGKDACVVFANGFLANQGALATVVGRHDVVYSDNENHASIIEGIRSGLGDRISFRHNNMADLERVLINTRDKYKNALIAADGVFSMSGDIFDLPAARALADKYQCGLFIDEAHALGVLGEQGRGSESHFGLPNAAEMLMGTFSKSFASVGGLVAARHDIINYIKHKARAFLFTAALPPMAAATALECLNIIETEPVHLQNLWRNARTMRTNLTSLGYDIPKGQSPIVPVKIGDEMTAFMFSRRLYEEGVFATPVVTPAVPKGHAMIRTSYMATHTADDLDFTMDVFDKLGKEFGFTQGEQKRAVA